MSTIADMWPFLSAGFQMTIVVFVGSAILSTIIGTVLAAMRVSPVLPFRGFGAGYVNIFRNTPLLVLFLLSVEGLPAIGVQPSVSALSLNVFETLAIVTVSIYTAAFVCEALRSGINTVDPGQAEAARAVGMTFGQSLNLIVMPQAFRAVIPPLANTYIAMLKNTAIAAAFGVTEATYQLSRMIEKTVTSTIVAFFGIAAGYIILVWVISGIAALLERQAAVSR